MPRLLKLFSSAAVLGVMAVALAPLSAGAAELVMFEQAGCVWCRIFDREIAPVYGKTEEGQRAPLRRVDTDRTLPPDLTFIQAERLTPLFVLVDKGQELGRIRGYPGEDNFWGLLAILVKKLDTPGSPEGHLQLLKNSPLFIE